MIKKCGCVGGDKAGLSRVCFSDIGELQHRKRHLQPIIKEEFDNNYNPPTGAALLEGT
jgi:hypothetical protein